MKTARIIKFESDGCSHCQDMEKAKVLDRISTDYPWIEIVKLTVSNKDGESPAGTHYEKNNEIAEEYDIEGLPTLVFEVRVGNATIEVNRAEGAVTYKQLKKFLRECISEDAKENYPWPL